MRKTGSSIPYKPWIKVVESETEPKVRSQAGLFLTLTGADACTEPIGDRIVETPISANDTEFLRNLRSGFIAYVPPGGSGGTRGRCDPSRIERDSLGKGYQVLRQARPVIRIYRLFARLLRVFVAWGAKSSEGDHYV
jgi:hypothetical protein